MNTADLHPKLDKIFYVEADQPERMLYDLETERYTLTVHKETLNDSAIRGIAKIREQEEALSKFK